MKYRQVHLDFHTSEMIPGIGEKFNKEQFQKMLKVGHVNSITLFSKCHHGWAYHPSTANEIHPHLKFDLLKAQIDAAHEIGVQTPVYLSVGFDQKMARRKPEWLMRTIDETMYGTDTFAKPGYHMFCLNSPYLDYLLAQIEEVVKNYDADRIFLDIVNVKPCYCQNCILTLINENKDPYDVKNIKELAERVYANYTTRVRESIDKYKKGLPVFHNGGHIRAGRRDLANMNTHLELESLPTGGWGYDHFPMSAAYARTLAKDYLGMTGKFHESWGEFGGFKHPNALRYEVALSASNGAKCSIGDQLHPSGIMDEATYRLIGEGYKMLEQREPWLENTKNVVDIGVLSNESICNYYNIDILDNHRKSDIGCVRTLLEGKHLFNLIDAEEDFAKYKALILPDGIRLDKFLSEKISVYIKNGGKVLASGCSGLYNDEDEFAIDLGVVHKGICSYKPSYIRLNFDIPNISSSSFVMYTDCCRIENVNGESLAVVESSYFNRTVTHFCSHLHAPSSGEVIQDAIIKTPSSAYIAYNIFEEYAAKGGIVARETVTHVLGLLFDKTVTCNLPAQGVITLTEGENVKYLHLLYASPIKRGQGVEVIEDILPVYGIDVSIKTSEPSKVYKVPEMQEIEYEYRDNRICFELDKLDCWQMVAIEDV